MTKNLWHSCGRFRLSDHFRGKPRVIHQTFDRFVKLTRSCGPVVVYAQKTRIVIQARVRFAGVVVRKDSLDAAIWMKRKIRHPLIRRIESFGRLGYGVHFRLRSPDDLDARIAKFIREAYVVGRQDNR